MSKRGKVVRDEPCPSCREAGGDKSGNHLMVFEDGGKFCNRCGHHEKPGASESPQEATERAPRKGGMTLDQIAALRAGDLPQRGLRAHDLEAAGMKVSYPGVTKGEDPDTVYFPRHKGGRLVGYKVKSLTDPKKYYTVGDGKDNDLVGMEQDGGRRLVIVTEGELDMVAARVMLAAKGKAYRVVSLPNGANTRLNKESFEFLSQFESIRIATDMDEPGEKAAAQLNEMFQAGKCRRMVMPSKDSNECLVNGETDEWWAAFNQASTMTADGIVTGEDTWARVKDKYFSEHDAGIPYPWEALNEKLYGMRKGDLDTWTSGSGMGKSAIIGELIHHLAITHDKKVGILALEESLPDAVLKQMSIAANKPLHLPEVREHVNEKELHEYWENTAGTGNLCFYDHWGSLESSQLLSKLRYLSAGMGCEYLFLDHLSIVVSEYADEGDERKTIDSLMSKLKRFTEEQGVYLGLVSHLRKSGGKPFEEGGVPSLDDLRGSASIKQLSHAVIGISRNQQHNDATIRNTSNLHVLKNRFCGRTGPAGGLLYSGDTGRLTACEFYSEDTPVLERRGIGS